jgi:carboxymethylenebutenolidase
MQANDAGELPGAVHDVESIVADTVAVPTTSGPRWGYLARPKQAPPRPAVVVIHELFGVNAHIRDVTRRLANVGYLALAPSLYRDLEEADAVEFEEGRARLATLADADVIGDIDACASYLRSLDGATGKVGAVGFCSGGRFVLLAACRDDTLLDAAVDCWGGFITRANPHETHTANRPRTPVDAAVVLGCPLLAVFGAEDTNPSPEDAQALRGALERHGERADVQVYEDAGHAFFADYRPSYRPEPAHALWSQMLSFFATHLTTG